MADICLVYARPNKELVSKLHSILTRRFTVWWDRDIHAGNYRAEIERQIVASKCVIPVWCGISRNDEDVVDEATYADKHGKPLLPIRTEDVDPPLGFGSLHTVDLLDWNGESSHPGIDELLANIKGRLAIPPRLLSRATSLSIGNKTIPLPVFFRSISSHETALLPSAALQALRLTAAEAILASAYDIYYQSSKEQKNFLKTLVQCSKAGSLVLLDSGNYEASRKSDSRWRASHLHRILGTNAFDLAFSFDELDPGARAASAINAVLSAARRDATKTTKPVMPIIHAPRSKRGIILRDQIPRIVKDVARNLRPALVAIPERELGAGVVARAQMVHAIRRELDDLGFYQPLHLLGTGNPISIAIFAAVGADSFDGLEWCRVCADAQTGRLFHFHQADFFTWQSLLSQSPLVQEAMQNPGIEYSGKAIFHNLDFFDTWMRDLRTHVHNGKIERFLTSKLPNGGRDIEVLEKAIPEVFR